MWPPYDPMRRSGRLAPPGFPDQAHPTGGSGQARLQSMFPSPQMRKYVHCEIERAPVISDVSADRKYVWRSGDVRVMPDRTTKNRSTVAPARKTRESGARATSGNERGLLVERVERAGE